MNIFIYIILDYSLDFSCNSRNHKTGFKKTSCKFIKFIKYMNWGNNSCTY